MSRRITIEPVDPDRDAELLHRWLTHPRSVYWMMQDATVEEVRVEHRGYRDDPHHSSWLGRVDGRPAFLTETYDPAHCQHVGLAGLPELAPGDLGMHLLVAPPEDVPEHGFTTAVFRAVMEHCFADPAVHRVVVEPDVRNEAIRAKNVAAGFVELREVPLEGKTAMLSVCTRADFEASALAAHLAEGHLASAQRHLVAKAIAEYAHERLVTPTRCGDGWVLATSGSTYAFTARVYPLEHWVIDEPSLTRTVDGQTVPLDAQDLIAELAPVLGIPDHLLPVYLEEIASTLAAAMWKLEHPAATVSDLVAATGPQSDPAEGYQVVERSMTEGHPAFVANNGRIGYGLHDYIAYAPETGAPVRLEWIAARRDRTTLALGSGVDRDSLYRADADDERLVRRLRAKGLDPEAYDLIPVHPWQWVNKLAITFAPDIARGDLVHLGPGEDEYCAQQSIRTFFNTSRPERHYVKTALSIQNMGFLRGLSPAYMAHTPAINDWIASTVRNDPALRACGFDVLREVAAIGYTGDAFHRHAASGRTSAQQKMITALWRESPLSRLGAGERLATMACLLHRDVHGDAMVTGLVKASSLDAEEWVRTYLRAYLKPLVHCLWAYDLVFMPHGENLVMVLRDHVPVRMLMKDIGEEAAVMGDLPLPPEVERIRAEVPVETQSLAIHTDVMDGVLRYVAAILAEDGVLSAEDFWRIGREVVDEHLADHPELADAAARHDLLRPEFAHSCLNRLQLRNTLEMVEIGDQADSLIFAGTLANPLAQAGRDA